jgi:hypothetical protein
MASTRKTTQDAKTAPREVPASVRARPRKKARTQRSPRTGFTHFEIRRGETLRLKIAVADDAFTEVGDELGALIKRMAPGTQTTIVEPVPIPDPEPDFIVSQAHNEHDATYHSDLRERLVELFGSFCDTALEDALDVARNERARRAEGGN